MKRVMMLCFLTVVVSAQAMAQSSVQKADVKPKDTGKAATDPTVDQIIDKFENVIGGRTAFEKFSSRIVKGTFELTSMGVIAPMEILSKSPNKQYSIVTVPGYGAVIHGFDGKIAWEQDPASGLREYSGIELAVTKLDSEFNKEVKSRQLYPKLELNGKSIVGGRETYVIIATPTEGKSEKWYFDTQNGLLLRCDMEREGPQGLMPIESYFEDYREVEGVKIPFTSRMTNSAMPMVYKIESVTFNAPVDDAKFTKPQA